MRLHFQTLGAGEPLIVLHGLFGSLDNLHSFNQRMAERYRVYAVDQRNHGRSPHSPEMDYGLMAEDLFELVQAERLSAVRLVGHSMGGKTAMEFALRFPQRVAALVVADIAPKAYPPHHQQILEGLLALDLSRHQTRREVEMALEPWVPEPGVRQFLLKSVTRHSSGHAFAWRMGLQEIAANYERLREAVAGGRTYPGPTLFIRGERSAYLSESDLEPARQLFPAARMEVVPGAGHWLHAEAPEVFYRLVAAFLAECAV
ncbi:MAG TPA: alpha/beta fold hydrolase [Candidatus Paceibacterota bacterium]|mgnify:FL=1|nr:alpha/beta fold hydrolase [Candidatus Paceibacterota bacterium]